jgi:tryptophanyl-tRNA synthetase
MSKTRGNAIALSDSDDRTAALIRQAPTDSDQQITYDPVSRPGIAALLELLASVTASDPRQLADEVGNGAGGLNRRVTEAVNELLRPVRQRRAQLVDDPAYLDGVLAAGNEHARDVAEQTLTTVHELLGMTYGRARSSRPSGEGLESVSRH